MKKIILIFTIFLLIISCGKKEPDYPIYTKDEKKLMYKGDNTALIELGEWEDVKLFYIAPPKKYKKPDLLNGMKW